MNNTPNASDSNVRKEDVHEELARLLPAPVDRDLPSGRRRHIQEFVMTQIQQDVRSAERQPRRAPRRRLAYIASGLVAGAAATVVAVALAAGGSGSTGQPRATGGESTSPAVTSLSGQQVLLAAAAVADRSTDRTGTYWYVKVVSDHRDGSTPAEYEYWRNRDGQTWFRGVKTGGKVSKLISISYKLGGAPTSFTQLQQLPTEPAALKTWINDHIKRSNVRTSGGVLDAKQREEAVFQGLISLVSQLPAPQKVRAAAFRAIAGYPDVTNLGPVDGGVGLRIGANQATIVIDQATAQVTRTNFYVSPDGALNSAAAGGVFELVSEWTDTLPS
jgi:hypothetical protein